MAFCVARVGLAFVALAVTVAQAAPAAAKEADIYPLAKVKRGQKGYGLTVLKGTDPDRFEFEVVGVLENALPRQDLVLVKSEDPKIVESGFAQGMSGSPLYLEGKVTCAISYVWRFSKIALAGCTPIENMIAEGKTPLRGMDRSPLAAAESREEWDRYQPLEKFDAGRALAQAQAGGARDAWLLASPLPPRPPASVADASGADTGLVRAGMPLSVTGLGPMAFEQARKIFSPYGLEPVQAGGGGGKGDQGPSKFVPGGSIAVMFIRGDVSSSGLCTVTHIEGDRVLGCGHPMMQMGEIYMPAATAEVHHVVASSQIAFKMFSPRRIIGALVQDRQSMIQADTSKRVSMIPVELTVKGGPGGDTRFVSEVARNRFLTPQLVLMAVINGAQLIFPDVADAVVTIDSKVHIKGYKPLAFTDYVYSAEGAGNAVATARGLRVLSPLLFNPWTPLTIERVEVSVAVKYEADYASIIDARVAANVVPYGKKFEVELVMQPFQGPRYVERVPVTLPERLAGQLVKIEVLPGDFARLDVAPPENVGQLIDALRKTYAGNVLVVTVYTADDGVAMGGKIVARLPDSALDSARPAASQKGAEPYKSLFRVAVPAKRVIQGRAELNVQVEEKRRR